MTAYNYAAIFTAFIVSYLIRVLPLTLIRKPIKNRFIKSFLYYVPYITLSVMTFPAIINAASHPAQGIAALIIGLILAWAGRDLFTVAVCCCAAAFIAGFFV